jgi:hypothetical protein
VPCNGIPAIVTVRDSAIVKPSHGQAGRGGHGRNKEIRHHRLKGSPGVSGGEEEGPPSPSLAPSKMALACSCACKVSGHHGALHHQSIGIGMGALST